jgi:hypothetical protein
MKEEEVLGYTVRDFYNDSMPKLFLNVTRGIPASCIAASRQVALHVAWGKTAASHAYRLSNSYMCQKGAKSLQTDSHLILKSYDMYFY